MVCFRSAAIGVALLMNHVLANHCFFGAWHLMLHNNEALFPTSEWSYFLCKTLQCAPSSASLKTKRVSSFTGQAKHRLIQKVLLLRCPFIGARVLHHLKPNPILSMDYFEDIDNRRSVQLRGQPANALGNERSVEGESDSSLRCYRC